MCQFERSSDDLFTTINHFELWEFRTKNFTCNGCERPLLGLNQFNGVTDRLRTLIHDGDYFGNESQLVPGYRSVFSDVPGTVPQSCGFKRNSSNLDRVPKMRHSILLSSGDSFLMTLHSISSETYVMYSSSFLRTDVFRDWLFLGCSSCVSLETAANFRLFLNVAIILKRKMLNSGEGWNIF